MLMVIMRAILGSHQRPADGCANLFQTNLSLTCRLPATPSCLGIHHFCPIPCFGSLAQSKIPTPVAIQILIYLPMLGLTRNRLTMYGHIVIFKFRCFCMIFRQCQYELTSSAKIKT
ncbi:hypothetical protein CGT73_15725 [Vibrio cholerae]|nr:hypothetical protein CGT83_01735 [Vibrio cholerae]PAR98833.1 hypothetical protein CGT79_14465 [Vibrio cholerae]PAS20557.1 hypothetical protein CGT73_15725 [Vibrio cholerae]